MKDLPDPDMKPEDVDKLIKSYGRPIDPERKAKLMQQLKDQRQVFEEKQKSKGGSPKENGNEDELSR